MCKDGEGEGANDDHDDKVAPGVQVKWLYEACPGVGSLWVFQEERVRYLNKRKSKIHNCSSYKWSSKECSTNIRHSIKNIPYTSIPFSSLKKMVFRLGYQTKPYLVNAAPAPISREL